MAKKIYYDDEKDLEGLKWTAKVVDFGVGLSVIAAINEVYAASGYLRDRPDLYRFKVKHFCNLAVRYATLMENEIKSSMKCQSFWLDYSDRVIDEAEQDILLFRLSVKQELDNAKIKDSQLLSFVECARVMLDLSVKLFDGVMDASKEKFGKDYRKNFLEFRIDSVLGFWEKMCEVLYRGKKVDLNTPHVKGLFDKMCDKFAEGGYIQACLEEAQKNNPEFEENEVEVKGQEAATQLRHT